MPTFVGVLLGMGLGGVAGAVVIAALSAGKMADLELEILELRRQLTDAETDDDDIPLGV